MLRHVLIHFISKVVPSENNNNHYLTQFDSSLQPSNFLLSILIQKETVRHTKRVDCLQFYHCYMVSTRMGPTFFTVWKDQTFTKLKWTKKPLLRFTNSKITKTGMHLCQIQCCVVLWWHFNKGTMTIHSSSFHHVLNNSLS